MGMSASKKEAISRGPSVHFASAMAFFEPNWPIIWGSSSKDTGLSDGMFLRRDVGLKRSFESKHAERLVSANGDGKASLFLTLDLDCDPSLWDIWGDPPWDTFFEVPANMLLIFLCTPLAGLRVRQHTMQYHSLWHFCMEWKIYKEMLLPSCNM